MANNYISNSTKAFVPYTVRLLVEGKPGSRAVLFLAKSPQLEPIVGARSSHTQGYVTAFLQTDLF